MKFASMLLVLFCFMSTASAFEAGFVFQGKKIVVYKDGVKVGKTHEEMFAEKSRVPSSNAKIPKSYANIMAYEEDDLARCYRVTGASDQIFCVKK